LRLGDNSSVTMISPSLTDTELRLDKGRATVEVAELHQGNNLVITLHGDAVRLLKTGLYDFDADHNLVRVFQGEAVVREMKRDVKLKGDRQIALGDSGSPKAEKFNKEQAQDDLYRWSSLRSSYTAEANVDRAQTIRWAAGTARLGLGSVLQLLHLHSGDGIFYSPFGWVSIRPSSLALLRLASLATSTMILMTFVTLKVESAVTGVTLVIGGHLVVGGS